MDDDRARRSSSGPHEAGMVVGTYKLVRRLDRGGMAEVWIAKNVGAGRAEKHVALKFIAPHLADDKRYRRLFRAEAEVAMMLNHANIVQVFGFDESYEVPYLVMEWVDGINLRKVRDSLAAMSEDRRVRIACYVIEQLLHALRYAHSIVTHHGQQVGLVHRDVTPQNVLVSNSAEVKLTDFGVAATSFDETSGLHVKGKIRYMAPEQLSGRSREKTVDLYAVGTIFHELLEGERFRGDIEDDRELYVEVLEGEIPETSCELPDAIEDLRCGLLEPDPAHRIQTADEALDLLCMIPRVGDPRRDLMRLCTGLTGIVVPRSGPGQSSMHGMARPRRGTKRTGSRRPRVSSSIAADPRAEESAPEGDELATGGRQETRSDGSAVGPASEDRRDSDAAARTPPAEISVTEQLDHSVLPQSQPSAVALPASEAPARADAAASGSRHPPGMGTLSAGHAARPSMPPASAVPSSPSAGSWTPVDHGVSAPIDLDPTGIDQGDASRAQAPGRPPAKRSAGMPLLIVSGLVLVATTATVTWLLANPEVESKASMEAVVPTEKTVEDKSAPPTQRPPHGHVPQGTAASVAPNADPHTESDGSSGPVAAGENGEGSDASGDAAGGEAPSTDSATAADDGPTAAANDDGTDETVKPDTQEPPSQPPPTPTMTIRVARKQETGPLWVWTGSRSAPYFIDSPPYKVIPRVPERSYIHWNTTKTKKGAKRQKVGKRKRNKIWNLVIKPTGTDELYLDE